MKTEPEFYMIEGRFLTAWMAKHLHPFEARIEVRQSGEPSYRNIDGVAVIDLKGPMSASGTYWGEWPETSTDAVTALVRQASEDSKIGAGLLNVDSPGGTSEGVQVLADTVKAANEKKPFAAFAHNLMASAALWPSVYASRIFANPSAEVGSIGTRTEVVDYSEAYKMMGMKVHSISTGDMKGAFTPGTEVTEEQLAYLQERVDALNGFFLSSVKEGRKMDARQLKAVSDGRVWNAKEAQKLGLIDQVGTYAEALDWAKLRAEGRVRRRSVTRAMVEMELTTV